MARTSTIAFCFAAALLVSCSQTHAQGLSIQARFGYGLVGLALQPEVAKEIGVADDKAIMAEILKWTNDIIDQSRRALNDAIAQQQALTDEMRQSLRFLYDENLKSVLTDEQFARLKQINWQIRDRNALTEPDVMDALEMKRLLALRRQNSSNQQCLRNVIQFVAIAPIKEREFIAASTYELTRFHPKYSTYRVC